MNDPSPSESEQRNAAVHPSKEKTTQHSEGVEKSGRWNQSAGGKNKHKEREEEEGDAVWVLRQEGDLETFTDRGTVVIVYFYRNSENNSK